MVLNKANTYSRKNSIIYENGIAIIKCKQSFIDLEKLSDTAIDYMNRYFQMFPELFEKLENMNNKIVKVFFDLETTGTDHRKHGIHQIAGLIEIDDEVVEHFNFKVAPNPKAQIDQEALTVCAVTEEQIKAYPEMKTVYNAFIKMLGKYIDKYDQKDKAWLIGYNNRKFDDIFLRAWFEQNGDSFFGSWFWTDSLDVLVLSSQYLLNRRKNMPSFKLRRVAKEVGLEVDESKLHDASYDIELTREIYRIVTGLEIEL